MLTQNLPTTATEYASDQRLEQAAAIAAIGRQWRQMGDDFDVSWLAIAPTVLAIMNHAQGRVADRAAAYIPAVLEETGQTRALAEVAASNTRELVGVTGAGYTTYAALGGATIHAKGLVESGETAAQALTQTGKWLSYVSGTILSDTKRAAEQLGMYTRDVGGYVRVLSPPSCGRCVIQAGKWFRKNQGFDRHPGCDCYHIPASEGLAKELTLDPDAYFRSLDESGQAKVAGSIANAKAVREGANLGQIVNAYKPSAGLRFAQESPIVREVRRDGSVEKFSSITRKSASFVAANAARRSSNFSGLRLMPETIYRTAKNREDALRLLRINGWIL